MADASISQVRTCTKCGAEKPATTEFFNRNPKGKFGLKAWCRDCTRAVRELQRSGVKVGQPEPNWPDGFKGCSECGEIKPATQEFFFAHAEGKLGLRPDCISCFLAECRARYERRRGDKPRRRFKPWQPHELKLCCRCGQEKPANTREFARYRMVPGGLSSACRACIKAYRTQNKEKFHVSKRASWRNWWARRKRAPGKHSSSDIRKLFQAQKGRCWWCSKKLTKYHVDHRIPLARGGSNGPENLVISCPHCNCTRGKQLPWEMEEPRLL